MVSIYLILYGQIKKGVNMSVSEKYLSALRENGEKEYMDFFKSKLAKYGAMSPDELSEEKKKQFFDEIDKEWKGKKEKD